MPNPYVNRVEKSDGTTIIDIRDTTAVASDVAEGKYFYLATGQKVSGTASGGGGSVLVVDTPDSHGGTIREITAQSAVTLQNSVTITPSEASQTINPSSGYDGFASAFVEAIPSEYIIPSGTLSITSNGTYDVSAFASAEVLVSGGGGYTVDDIALRAISGSISGSASVVEANAFAYCLNLTGATFLSATIVNPSAFYSCYNLQEISFPICEKINQYAFFRCSALTSAYFPVCESISSHAFDQCPSLGTINFPKCRYIGLYAFAYASAMESISFPKCEQIGDYAFNSCSKILTVSLPTIISVYSNAFAYCYSLSTIIMNNETETNGGIYGLAFRSCRTLLSLYLLASKMYELIAATAFTSTPISTYTTYTGGVQGSIFVPEGIYNSYITATNWATYSARFVSLTSSQVQHVIDYGTHVM